LLCAYRNEGAFTDCYVTEIARTVSQAEYVQAFYTTTLFKVERTILKWAVSKPSTDEDASLLAEAKVDTFAAWFVEARRDDQLLLSDYRGRTRSWLMSELLIGSNRESTRLYFGSAVIPMHGDDAGAPRMGTIFRLLIRFHKMYSQALLSAARSRLSA